MERAVNLLKLEYQDESLTTKKQIIASENLDYCVFTFLSYSTFFVLLARAYALVLIVNVY